jgi:dipeptidase
MTANEPVAWINLDRFKDEALYLADCVSENKVENMGITTPLYTHPAKTLTDEEIHQVFRDTWDATTNPNCVFTAFARAILRKAQEK